AAVQPRGVVSELIKDLIHLEGGQNRLDQHSSLDCCARDAQALLGVLEDLVPEPGLKMRLYLWQIEIRPSAVPQKLHRVMEEIQAKVKERGGHGLSMPWRRKVFLKKVPASRANKENRSFLSRVVLAFAGA